ncbi:MAG: hypothetical protein JW984_02650 [Deltaproteobacteria bacterium]|uniref:Uncharacterized protein n=1 Tax=Candidatus Zymogenus saltonus TaxID=2844893 RepID=A0A9D8KAE4_9DELT|nr:hypothetical protein [Candidatus Zymogenus saltonus]
MKKEIAKNDLYEIYVDTTKNRTHIIYRGFWENLNDVPNLLEDHKRAMSEVKRGFTSITDISEMKTPGQDVIQLLIEMRNISNKKGQGKIARIVDKALIKIVSRRVDRESDMDLDVENFATYKEAEAWLDSFEN